MTNEYDLVILGGGTGGYVAAIRARQLGMQVALVEKEKVGGTCLHQGCIPSKALLKSAEMYREIKQIDTYGIEIPSYTFHISKAQTRKNKIVETLYQGVQGLLKKAKVDVYHGFGRILGPSIFSPIPGTISIEHQDGSENTILTTKHVMIATGSSPRPLPGLAFDGEYILNSDDALQLEVLPTSMLIVGGGVIGIEWASLLCDLGVKVTVVENSPSILMTEDKEIVQVMKQALEKRGVTFYEHAMVDTDVQFLGKQVIVPVTTKGETMHLTVDKVLVSIGRSAYTDEIGLGNTSIVEKNGFIEVNEMYQTKEKHIYAIGDCIGGMQLAHVASTEGIIAVEHMANLNPSSLNTHHVPTCIYSYPEASKIGYTERAAIEAGFDIKVSKFPFQGVGKAHVNGQVTGMMKMITDKATADILGIHIIGPGATDMISEASLATFLDATAWELSQTIRPHPSLTEIYTEASLAIDRRQIHG